MKAESSSLYGLEFIWIKEMQKAFEEMKVLLTTDALTAYPDHNKPFKIYKY